MRDGAAPDRALDAGIDHGDVRADVMAVDLVAADVPAVDVPVADGGRCASGGCLAAAGVALGRYHACAWTEGGMMSCWGRNEGDATESRLRDGTTQSRSGPAPVSGLGAVTQVVVATNITCALRANRTVTCWEPSRPSTTEYGGLRDVAEVALAKRGAHTCARLGDGTVRCWGDNESGQLGDGSTTRSDAPVAVREPMRATALTGVRAVTAGDEHSCALTTGGAVICWGGNNLGQLGIGTMTDAPIPSPAVGIFNAEEVSAGADHTCAILGDHTVRCWGSNASGQLGDGSTTGRLTPTQVLVDTAPMGYTHIATGDAHTCGVARDGGVRCWGRNDQGQLGDGTSIDRPRPVAVSGLPTAAARVFAGPSSTCALLTDRSLWCWGQDDEGQLGDDSVTVRVAARVQGLTGVAQIAAGALHTCARLMDGTVRCWGADGSGQLGDRPNPVVETLARSTPVSVTGLSGVTSVSLGAAHTCAQMTDGTVRCWGRDRFGQLGASATADDIPTVTPQTILDRAGGSALASVRQLASGYFHACALLSDGTVRCWGTNEQGQLGVDTMPLQETNPVPFAVTNLRGVTEVALAGYHTCARLDGGAAQCWGTGDRDSLGTGTQRHPEPRTVRGLATGAAQLALGDDSTCARLTNGEVQCWGSNAEGQLGVATSLWTRSTEVTPVTVLAGASPLRGVAEIAVGGYHVCARLADQTVRCWGLNNFGQLGDGTVVTRSEPAPVPGLTDVIELSAGGYHTCARLTDQTVRCWGRNTHGQVGDGVSVVRSIPRSVLRASLAP